MALEQEYLERLARTSAFAVTGDRLELSLADGSGMAFRAGSPDRRPQRPRLAGKPPGDELRLVLARPWRHRDRDRGERRVAVVAELKARPGRDRERDARRHLDDLFPLPAAAPHPALAGQEIPDLLDRAVHDRPRDLARAEGEMRHAAAAGARQDAHLAAIRRDHVGGLAKRLGDGLGSSPHTPLSA